MSTKKKVRILNGYRVIYRPENESSMTSENWNGYIYEHRYVAEKFLGRFLSDDEVVHHLDGNKMNNRSENLIVLLEIMHPKLHAWIDRGLEFKSDNSFQILECSLCSLTLQGTNEKYCSDECFKLDLRKVERPSKEILRDDIDTMSWLAIGRKYGVSDNAVRKWAKKYGII